MADEVQVLEEVIVEPTMVEEVVPTDTDLPPDPMTTEEEFRFDPFADVDMEVTPAPLTQAPVVDPAVTPVVDEPLPDSARIAMLEAQIAAGPAAPVEVAPAVAEGSDEILNELLTASTNLQCPPQLLEAINSSDPQMQAYGIQQMMQAVSASAIRAVHVHYGPQFANMDTTVQSSIKSHETSRQVYEDFYGTYPGLNKPGLHGMVQETMKTILATPGRESTPYSAALRDEAAQLVATSLGIPLDGLRGAKAPGSLPVKPQGSLLNGGARPAGAGTTPADPQGAMMESLGLNPNATLPQ